MGTPRKISENYIATEVDDEIVLIDMAGGELFSLKGTARAIWEAIDGERSLNDIADEMVRQFDVDKEEAIRDTGALAADLQSAKLLIL